MSRVFTLKNIALLLLIALNFSCDQWSKAVVRKHVAEESYTELAGPYLIQTRVENTGAFLGLGRNWNPWVKRIFLQGMPMLVLLWLIVRLLVRAQTGPLLAVGLGCIVGGGLGNLWDRMASGSVTDFLQLKLGPFHTGIFNMADVSVTTGLLIVVLAYFLPKDPAA